MTIGKRGRRVIIVDDSPAYAEIIVRDRLVGDVDGEFYSVLECHVARAENYADAADSMKHERTAPVRIGHVSKLDCFVTNARQLPHLFGICRDNDVEVVIAGDS